LVMFGTNMKKSRTRGNRAPRVDIPHKGGKGTKWALLIGKRDPKED